MNAMKQTMKATGWFLLATSLLAGTARAQLPVLVSQDFEAYATTSPGSSVITMADGWVRYKASVSTNNVPDAGHGTRVGNITASSVAELRYWCSPAITGHVGTLTFDTSIYRVTEATPTVNMVVFLADTNNKPTGYTPYTNITLTATNQWISHTVVFDQYNVTNKYLVIGRDQVDTGSFRLQFDKIELRGAPSSMALTGLALEGGGTTRFSNEDLGPVLSFDSIGTVDEPIATLYTRYSGGTAWSPWPMTASGETYVLSSPIPAAGVSNRQLEMYAVLRYSNALGAQTNSWPLAGSDDPVRIDILPFSINDPMEVQGGLTAVLSQTTNLIWSGGMEREAGVASPTYAFVGPSNSWGAASAPSIPYAVGGEPGQTLPSPADPLTRDIVFGLTETPSSQISAQYGNYQSFENWGVTSGHGWTLGTGVVVTNDAAAAQAGTFAVRLPGGTNGWFATPTQTGVREASFWFRRLGTGTNVVTVTMQKRIGATWSTINTFAGTHTDQYAYRSVTINDPLATAIRVYADAPALLDNVAATDVSDIALVDPLVSPNPVEATQPADASVQVDLINGAEIIQDSVVLNYRYGTVSSFSQVTLILTGGVYRTRSNARIAPAPDASQDLQYYMTAAFTTWDDAITLSRSTATNTVRVVPYSAWDWPYGVVVTNGLNAPLSLASNQLWRGAVLVTSPVAAPTFRFQDSTNGWWGSTQPKMQPATGTVTNGVQFAFTNAVSSSLAFSFNEANREYLIQSADYEPFEAGALQPGWSATNVQLSATVAVRGEAALTTNATAVVVSPTCVGVGDVTFWACMTNPAATSTYTVQKLSGGTWTIVGNGSVSGGFHRYFRTGAGDPEATQARVLFGSAGVRVDELVVTSAGAYVALSNPTFTTNSITLTATTSSVPVVAYGQFPVLGITATPQNGAAAITVRVDYTPDANPTRTNSLTLIGNSAGGVFTNAMPALAVGTNRYWYVVNYTGMSAAEIRYPATGYYRYSTDGALGVDRQPDPVAWAAALGPNYINNRNIDGWNINGVYLRDEGVQFDAANGQRSMRSPALNGVGSVYFRAKPTNPILEEDHLIAVELATSSTGPWTTNAVVKVAVGSGYTTCRVVVNDYRNPLYVRLRRISPTADPQNRLAVRDVVITPPPADVTIREPSIITPGYPSKNTPVTFRLQMGIKAGSESYPAYDFEPALWWRWVAGTNANAWAEAPMTNTAVSGQYAMTIPAQAPGRIEYCFKADFSGPAYIHNDGTTVHDESRSPAYLGWDGAAFTNSVQTSRVVPTPRPFRVNMFDSNHSVLELQRYDTPENTDMILVGDHTWQAVLYLTNAVTMGLQFAGTNSYTLGASAYGPVQSWGDVDQVTTNPPLSGMADLGGQDIAMDMDYVGFVMFRFNAITGDYQVRRAALQDFDTWQASDVYFEESLGLFAVKEYVTDFEGIPLTVRSGITYGHFDNSPTNALPASDSPPYNPPFYAANWRLENAWVIRERVPTTNSALPLPPANQAVRINAGAGTLQTTPNLHTDGRDALRLRQRVTFGDENVAYYKNGFTWKDYQVRGRAAVLQASPGFPTLSLIGYYYDRYNFYELRLTQDRVTPGSNSTERVVGQLYRKKDGVYTAVGSAVVTNNVSLAGKTWNVGMTLNTTGGSSVQLSAYLGVVGGVTNRIAAYADTGAGDALASGGTVSINVHDTVTEFSQLQVLTAPGGLPMVPVFANDAASKWDLGGPPYGYGGTGTRWTWASPGALTRPLPSVPFSVGVIRVGEEESLPDLSSWTTVHSGSSTSLEYTTVEVPLTTWDNTFLQIRPGVSDGMLMVDDLVAREWRGVTVTDPAALPPNDPLKHTVWRAEQAYTSTHGGSRMLELTRSRANPANPQMLVSPVMENGVGTVSFNYAVTGGDVRFGIERNADDGYVDDGDIWVTVTNVVVAAGVTGEFYVPIRTNMVGRVRILMRSDSGDAATLWLDNLFVTDYPRRDNTSWSAYNALITKLQGDKTFEPGLTTHRTAFLNNSTTLDVRGDNVLDEDRPFIQSPELATGIGEIGFWYRAWDPTAEFPGKLRLMKGPSTDAPLDQWTEVTLVDPQTGEALPEDALYKAKLNNITNSLYEYLYVQIFDQNNKVLRIYSETNQASRVALDQIIVTEPVRASIDVLSVKMNPGIPLAGDPVGVEVWLGNPSMSPENIRVFLDYRLGTNVWGVANWGGNPVTYQGPRVELMVDLDDPYHYTATNAIPAQPVDSVVQYRVVVEYDGTFAPPTEYTDFTNPEWYYPVDLNAQYAELGFAPHYFVFSCPTGAVFINEFFNAAAPNSEYYDREFVEVIGPRNASVANWKLDVVDASFSADADYVRTSYTIPSTAYLHGGTNGWGFYVLGDDGPAVSNRVDYYFPDGGDPAVSPKTSAYLPLSGGFRLVRGMGAYVDRISYGSDPTAQVNMVNRGYTYTILRPNVPPSEANRSVGLTPDATGTNLTWGLISVGIDSLGGMNPLEDEVLGVIDPYPEPADPDPVPAALALEITNLQLSSGIITVTTLAYSTNNGTESLSGWFGLLETNANPASEEAPGWGEASATQAFDDQRHYDFDVPEGGTPLFFRVKARYAP